MSPEASGPDDSERWMDFARADLRIAVEGIRHGYRLEPLCFHAQQAAEKALKAVLIARRIPFPKIHDLKGLLKLYPDDLAPPPRVLGALSLSDYAEAGRYPQGFEDVTPEDHRKAVESAKAVVNWVEKVLKSGKGPSLHEPRAAYRVGKLKRQRKKSQKKK